MQLYPYESTLAFCDVLSATALEDALLPVMYLSINVLRRFLG